jgi:DNA ligase (NAD+)
MSYDPNVRQLVRTTLDRLIAANEAYRNGQPIMGDPEYDALEDSLVELLPTADPTWPEVGEAEAYLAAIGAPPADDSGWTKVTHSAPMTSLNKAQSEADFRAWHASCGGRGDLVVSDKCDGISCSLRYVGGKLVQALTRGDGDVGEDITRNVERMKGVVHVIKGFDGHLRGEIVLLRSDWKAHFPTYSNPRNAAGGIAKRLDGVGCEHLTVLHYQMLRDAGNGTTITRKNVEFRALSACKCAVPNWAVLPDIAAVQAVYDEYVATKRDALDYDIDGLVVEHDDIALMESLGDLNKRPRGATAWKFPHDAKPTVLRNIRWQVGKSGRITPVAEFDVVSLAGANVSNASLHNLANIEKLCKAVGAKNLAVGDEILASRRNDVIPFCEALLASKGGSPLVAPDECPACSTNLIMQGEYLLCRGEDCPAQVLGGISRWVKKVGVLGIGDSIIEALIEHAGVTDPADLYTLDPAKIESIPTGSDGSRLGRTAHIIVAELKAKAEVPLHTFVGSLGIPLCARSVCKTIVDAGFDDLDKMQAATMAHIAAIPGMGTTKAEEFVKGLATRRTLMDKLQDNGVTIKAKAVGSMTGKSVCFTGVRSPEMEKAIEDAGGTVKGSVGKGLTYLVQNDKTSQSGKTKDAVKHGVQIVDLAEMWVVLGRPQGGSQPVVATAPRTQRKAQPVAAPTAAPAPATTPSALDLFGDSDP